jgi:4-hydroxy-tetrahydrodipicolinate synthase
MNTKFDGLIAFTITPTDSQGNFDPKALRVLIDRMIDAGADGIGTTASSGAGVYFTEEERKQIAAAAVKIVKGRVPAMIGTGAITTAETIRLSQHAESIGADAVVIVPANYWPLTPDEVYRHYERVAKAIHIPISVYNNPKTTQVDILPELAGRLSSLPHLDVFKEIAVDLTRLNQIRQCSGGKLSIAYGRDAYGCEALIAGADAWQSGIACVIPEHCVRITKAVKKDKDYDLARKYAAEIKDFCLYFSEKGLIRSGHTALEMMGIRVGKPRPPIELLENTDAETLRKHLVALGLVSKGKGAGTGHS